MIIVKIKGGLGNQLFQYAAGRHLAEMRGVELKLDLSYINADPNGAYTKRELELDVFNVKCSIAEKNQTAAFLKNSGNRYVRTICRNYPGLFKHAYIAESGNLFHDKFYSYPKNTYLDGFWQSEKYFKPIRSVLLEELSLKNGLTEEAQALADKIISSNAVSVHIRRGDYVSDKNVNSHHGALQLDFYQNAMEALKQQTNVDHAYVFSDDIKWCKENIKFDLTTSFVEFTTKVSGSEEMMLMSKCKHNIIANSSFSWWAAWLNRNESKRVVAPKNWFTSVENPDIYPEGWIKL